jgi:predicted acetyltransferase
VEAIRSDFPAHLRELAQEERDEPGRVPVSWFWLLRQSDNCLVGTSLLRHRLSEGLLHDGGHIGYSICPTQRRKGYGTCLLALTLDEARRLGLERVLVMSGTDNLASIRIIENNGGVYHGRGEPPETRFPVYRYWITL